MGAMFVERTPQLRFSSVSGSKDTWLWHNGDKYIYGGKANIYARESAKDFVIANGAQHQQKIATADRMLSIARATPNICVDPSQLDSDTSIITFRNGCLDTRKLSNGLTDAQLIKPNADILVTKSMGCKYPAGAPKCPKFDKFISDIYCEDKDLIDYEFRRGGYDLLGSTDEQKLHFLEGGGANGKSTLIKILLAMMGDYGRAFRSNLICGFDKDQFNTADLQGVRLAAITELSGTLNPAESEKN